MRELEVVVVVLWEKKDVGVEEKEQKMVKSEKEGETGNRNKMSG